MPVTGNFRRQTLFIAGQWVAADGGETIPVYNPATGKEIGTVPNGGAAETHRAIDAAHAAFQSFKTTTAEERGRLLERLAALIGEHTEVLAQLLTLEQGKPISEARGEITMSRKYISWFAAEARRTYGEIIPSPWPGRKLMTTLQPVGVVGAITPWNFPSSMLARKIGPAIAAGCTLVIKPATQTPFSALAWGVLAEMAGIPKGVVNIVTGSASAIGGALTDSPKVAKITFTGSTPVGKMLMESAVKSVKRVSMELGGNAPFIVFDDADLDAAVAGAIASKYRNSGQTCVCTNRIYVQAGIHDAFVEKFVSATRGLKVGPGQNEANEQGPVIDDRAIERLEAMIADATARGGMVATGGAVSSVGPLFFEPTVIIGATAQMELAQDEIFGPIAPVFKFDTEEEAIAAANATEYGLACYFYTKDIGRALRVADALDYGIVGVNEGIVTTEVAPFGGFKQSGIGREGGRQGIADYLETKYICMGGLGQNS